MFDRIGVVNRNAASWALVTPLQPNINAGSTKHMTVRAEHWLFHLKHGQGKMTEVINHKDTMVVCSPLDGGVS